MSYEAVVIQTRDESVSVAGYRYILVLKHPANQRAKALAASGMYELTQTLYNALDAKQWQKIEPGLAISGAWKGDLEIADVAAPHFFSNL